MKYVLNKSPKYLFAAVVFFIAILIAGLSVTQARANGDSEDKGTYVPGQAIVCIQSGNNQNGLNFDSSNLDGKIDVIEDIATLESGVEIQNEIANGGNNLKNLIYSSGASPSNSNILNSLNSSNSETDSKCKVVLVACEDVESFCGSVKNDEDVLWAQPNYIYQTDEYKAQLEEKGNSAIDSSSQENQQANLQDTNSSFNDPCVKYQWGFDNSSSSQDYSIDADAALSSTSTSNSNVVAVIDTGVAYDHPDMQNNMWADGLNHSQLTSLGGGKYGISTVGDSQQSTDPQDTAGGHGTHCAGEIAATTNNNIGMAGATNNYTKIMACRAFSATGGSTSAILKAYRYVIAAKTAGVNISTVSNSWGSTNSYNLYDYALESLIVEAGKSGIISCYSAGNDAKNIDQYGGVLHKNPYTITVGASTDTGKTSCFSNYGQHAVDVYAPGTNMLSCASLYANNGNYLPWVQEDSESYYKQNFGTTPSDLKYVLWNDSTKKASIPQVTVQDGAASISLSSITKTNQRNIVYVGVPKSSIGWTSGSNLYLAERFSLQNITPLVNSVGVFSYSVNSQGSGSATQLYSYALNVDNSGFSSFSITPSSTSFMTSSSDNYVYFGISITPTNIGSDAKLVIDELGYGKTNSQYCYMNGTSMACPLVSASCAYLSNLTNARDEQSALKVVDYIKGGVKASSSIDSMCEKGGVINLNTSANGVADPSLLNPVVDTLESSKSGSDVLATVTGNFFGEETGQIKVDGQSCTVTQWNDTSISFKISNVNEHLAEVVVTKSNGKQGRSYNELKLQDMGYSDLPVSTIQYKDSQNRTYTTQDLDVLKCATTDKYLYTIYCAVEANLIVMERFEYATNTWSTVELPQHDYELDMYQQGVVSMASGHDEVYLLLPVVDSQNVIMRLITFSDSKTASSYDVSLGSNSNYGDMICNVNGELWLAGCDYYSNSYSGGYDRSANIVKVYPDTGDIYATVGNFPNNMYCAAGNMSVYDGKVVFSDTRNTFYMSLPMYSWDPNVEFYGPLIYSGGQWTECSDDLYNNRTYSDSAQLLYSAGNAIDKGILELGITHNNGTSNMVDNNIYTYSGTLSQCNNVRFSSYKNKNISSVCHDGAVYVLGKHTLDDAVSFRTMKLSSISAKSENVDTDAQRKNNPISVDKIVFEKSQISIEGETPITLNYTIYPTNATNKDVNWYSSDESVCTVSNGVVTPKKIGNAVVTAKTVDGEKAATCSINVNYILGAEITSEKGSSGSVDETNRFSVAAEGGSGNYTYEFYIDGSKVQAASSKAYYDFMPTKGGKYKVTCNVIDSDTQAVASADFYYIAMENPRPVVSSYSINSASLKWDAVSQASKYSVAIVNPDGSLSYLSKSVTPTSYTASGLSEATKYKFLVQAYIDNKWTPYSDLDYVEVNTKSKRPVVSVTGNGDGYTDIEWFEVEGATKYAIAEYVNGSYYTYTYDCKTTSYHCDNLPNGFMHYLLVQAYVNGGWTTFTSSDYVEGYPVGPTKPKAEVVLTTKDSITVKWDKVAGSTEYAVAARDEGGQYHSVFVGKDTTQTVIPNLVDGSDYACLVQSKIYGSWTKFEESDHDYAQTKAYRPKVTAQCVGDGEVELTWDAIEGAENYYAYEVVNGTYAQIGDILPSTATSVTKDNLANDYDHYFLVQAKVDGKWSPFSSADYAKARPTGTTKPKLDTPSVVGTNISLSWGQVPGASCYAIATKIGSGGYTTYSYSCTDTSFTITGLEENVTYSCLVQAYINGRWSSFGSSDHKQAITNIIRPKVSATPDGDGIVKLTWDAVKDAQNYYAYEIVDGNYIQIGDIMPGSAISVSKDNLANDYEHVFLVQAYVGGRWSSYSADNYVYATPRGTIKPILEDPVADRTSITLNWNKVPGASCYAIATKISSSGYTTYSYTCTDTTFIIKGLTPNTTYDCLVQANINGRWSQFSNEDLRQATTQDPVPTTSTITFALDGGTTTSGKTTFSTDIGKTYSDFVFDTPYKSGYIFDYWSANGKGGAAINPAEAIPANVTLTANYKQDKSASQYISDMGLTQTSFSNFYEIDFPDYDYTYAVNRLKNSANLEEIGLPEGFSCTSCRKGNFYGRNLDARAAYETAGNEYVIHTPQTASKHATVGMSFSTLSDPTSTSQINNIKMLPFYLFDGINDAGLVCSTNAINSADAGVNPGTDPGHQKSDNTGDIVSMMAVRYCLDYASSIDEAIKLLSTKNISAINLAGYSEFHMQIADATGENAVIEFDWADSAHTKKIMKVVYGGGGEFNNVCTNFLFLGFNGTEASMQTHGWGYERYKVIDNALNGSSPAAMSTTTDMLNVMQKVYYSQMYKSEWFYDYSPDFWWSDYYGGSLSKNTAKTKANFQSKFDYYQQQISSSSGNYEKTLYSTAYDIANKTFSVRRGENVSSTLDFGLAR